MKTEVDVVRQKPGKGVCPSKHQKKDYSTRGIQLLPSKVPTKCTETTSLNKCRQKKMIRIPQYIWPYHQGVHHFERLDIASNLIGVP